MEIVKFLKNSTQAECREIGELMLLLADSPRDHTWQANMEIVAGRFQSPRDLQLKDHFERWQKRQRKWQDALYADGTSHLKLLMAELERRGDKRSEREYLAAIIGENGGTYSDVEKILKDLG